MGEAVATGDIIYGNNVDSDYSGLDHNPPRNDIVCLHSFNANNLKYVHNAVFGYNKCKLTLTRGNFDVKRRKN